MDFCKNCSRYMAKTEELLQTAESVQDIQGDLTDFKTECMKHCPSYSSIDINTVKTIFDELNKVTVHTTPYSYYSNCIMIKEEDFALFMSKFGVMPCDDWLNAQTDEVRAKIKSVFRSKC